MRRIVIALMSTVTVLVLLFSYRTSTDGQPAAAAGSTAAAASGTTGGGPTARSSTSADSTGAPPEPSSPSSRSSRSPSSRSPSAAASATSSTYTGAAVDTRWGVVQVQITVDNATITSADAVQLPQGNPRDQQINAYAVPVLDQEVLRRQSADIDVVSGATVTSEGYLQSLQSAIDQAHR